MKATLPGERLKVQGRKSVSKGAVIVASTFLVLVALAVLVGKTPWIILCLYLILSLITFLAYGFDKVAAKDGDSRTPENTLHWLAFVGGWPGALVAQEILRHKSKKQPFRMVFWITVVLNVGVFAWTFTPSGAAQMQSWFGIEEVRLSRG